MRARIGTRGVTVVVSTVLVVLSGKLGQPRLAMAAPTVSYLCLMFLAAIFAWFRRWELERGLTRLKKIADSLPAGPERSRLERQIQGIRKADTAGLVRALRNRAGHEQSGTVARDRRARGARSPRSRSRGW